MKRLALALVAVLLTLGLGELAARALLDPPRYHDHLSPVWLDPEVGFRGIPNLSESLRDDEGAFPFELNEDGLRGRPIAERPAASGAPARVLLLGDSFLVARALRAEHTTSERLERSAGVEVTSLATIDHGTAQQLLLLRRYGEQIAPDAIVLALYPANDVVNNSPQLAGSTTVSAGDPIRPYLMRGPEGDALRLHWRDPGRSWLRHRSRLFATVERAWLPPGGGGATPTLTAAERARDSRPPAEDLEVFADHDPGHRWSRAWRQTEDLLLAVRNESERLDARLLVVVIPSVNQVERTARGTAMNITTERMSGRSLDHAIDWNLPEKRLTAFLEREGIEVRLLLPALREAARAGEEVYLRDEHLSARGHEIMTAAIAAWLAGEPGESGVAALAGRGAPIERLPGPVAAVPVLHFDRDPHYAYVGNGWLDWAPEQGWVAGGRALVILRGMQGELILRGAVPETSPLPIQGYLELAGRRVEFAFDAHGPFEERWPFAWPALRPQFLATLVITSAPVEITALGVEPER